MINKIKPIFVLLLILLLCSCNNTNKNNYKNNINNVVEIYAHDDENESFGTGFFIDKNIIVTNCHIIAEKEGDNLTILNPSIRFFDEEQYTEVEIIDYNLEKDFAKLLYNGNHKHSYYKEDIIPEVEDKCFVIGNFNNYGLSYKEGYVSLKSVNLNYNGIIQSYIQVSISIGQGDSGAPVISKDGKLIGMITFRTKNQGSNYVEQGFAYAIFASEFLK